MLVHTVIFRTRQKDKLAHLREGLETLRNIDGVEFIHIGEPVASARPVVDDFFDFALIVAFKDDEAGLERYAEHPIHVAFVENYIKPDGAKIQVFDVK